MPPLSKHERSGAIKMLQARVRVYDVTQYYNCHPLTLQRLRDYYATGTIKDRHKSGKRRIMTHVKLATHMDCIKDICINNICSDRLPSVPDE